MMETKLIKAARALLGWTQAELSRQSGLSVPAIANIERGSSQPRQNTLALLQKTLEAQGVEFLEPPGVQLTGERFRIRVWSGREAPLKLWQDLQHSFADGKGGDVLFSGVNERDWNSRYSRELPPYLEKMKKLGARYRLLICEGDNFIIGHPDQYRQVPKAVFAQTPYCVYRDKLALIVLGRIVKVTIIENPAVAATFRTQFESNWTAGRTLEEPHIHKMK